MAGASENTNSTTTQRLYLNLMKNFKDSFFCSLSDAVIHSMLYMRPIQGQQILVSLTSWIEAKQYYYKIFHNWLILDGLTFYFIVQFSRLAYS